MKSTNIKSIETTQSLTGEPILTVRLDRSEIAKINEIGSIEDFAKYELEIKKKRKKRSLDANAYCWVLIGKIAKALSTTPDEAYRQLIREVGAYIILPVKAEAVEQWERIWTSKGTGWLIEDLGENKLKGYHNLRCWYGSSVYDSSQMARLIDETIRECKGLGIETLTPMEIERLKEEWR